MEKTNKDPNKDPSKTPVDRLISDYCKMLDKVILLEQQVEAAKIKGFEEGFDEGYDAASRAVGIFIDNYAKSRERK